MLSRVSAKCLGVFLIIFLMYPKGSYLSVSIGNQPEYYHAIRRTNMKFSDNIPPVLRNHEKIADKENVEDDEPGFDITEEELKKFKLWDKGIVPYYIDVLSFADKVLRDRIRWFLNLVNSMTSLNFVEIPRPPKEDESRWVFFVNRRGRLNCADHSVLNFTNKGVQPVPLGYDCMNTGGELAEAVLAIAGIPPQHNAPNRDDYIEILEENIIPEKKYLFKKMDDNDWLFHDVSYDFASAGHFHHHKYSVNGRATIKTKNSAESLPAEKSGRLSEKDIWKINMLYNYLIKSKQQMNSVSQCNKLFLRGKKKPRPLPGDPLLKPRSKPNKYLGIEEESNISKANDTSRGHVTSSKEESGVEGEEKRQSDVINSLRNKLKNTQKYGLNSDLSNHLERK